VSFINNLLGKTQEQRKKNLVLIIYITMAVVLLLTFAIIATLIADRADKLPEGTPDDEFEQSVQPVTKNFEFRDTKKGTLLVVNKNTDKYDFELNPESQLKQMSTNIPKVSGVDAYILRSDRKDTFKANAEALAALNKMAKDFAAQNTATDKQLTVWTAYRSEETQNALGSSVGGGHSDFHTGMLFELTVNDTANSIASDTAFAWIYENAHKYGFIERYPEAKSTHTGVSNFDNAFRYVGVAHATYMKTNGICLEEYVALLQSSNGAPLTAGGYSVTYAKIGADGKTEVSLPSASATVSGDNMGGIIITSKK
jgi:D-alanyl-D-alanine carboxypeptidase